MQHLSLKHWVAGAGILLALLITGCGGGDSSSSLTTPGNTETLTRGNLTLNIAWSAPPTKASRFIPADTTSIRVDVMDGEGTASTQTVARPADTFNTRVTFTNVAGGDIRLSAVAFNADSLPVAWGTGWTYQHGTNYEGNVYLEPSLGWWYPFDTLNPYLVTGQLVWKHGTATLPVPGCNMFTANIKDPAGTELWSSPLQGLTAQVFICAGGKFYAYFDSGELGSLTQVQLPIVPDSAHMGGNPPNFDVKYQMVTLGERLVMQDLGSIELIPAAEAAVIVQ